MPVTAAAKKRFGADPWRITENKFEAGEYGLRSTLFALGNGYIGIRGTIEEGVAAHYSENNCYLNGVYTSEPITYGEKAYGYAKNNQKMASVPFPFNFELKIDGRIVDLSNSEMVENVRYLDLLSGVLVRETIWKTSNNKVISIKSKRFVSLANKNLAALRYELTAVNFSGVVEVTSSLECHDHSELSTESDDPRVGGGQSKGEMELVYASAEAHSLQLIHKLKSTGFVTAVAAINIVNTECPVECVNFEKSTKVSSIYKVDLKEGCSLGLTKYALYYSVNKSNKLNNLFLENNLAKISVIDFDVHAAEHAKKLSEFWENSDVSIDGDIELLQGIRFNLFHLYQSVGKDGLTNIAAKGLTGHGYDGHYFWDTEIYIFPFFLFTQPSIAKNLLRYRHSILDAARARAREMSITKGALFPWRTIGGEECSAYYPAGTAQYHINADIAYAVKQYLVVTEDHEFIFECAAELVIEGARMWMEIGHFNKNKNDMFCICDVTGPDEYTAIVNNNYFTNAMAKMHLNFAVDICGAAKNIDDARTAQLLKALSVDDSEIELWKRAAELMYLPYSQELGIHLQDDSFLDKPLWNFKETPETNYPLLLHYHPLVIYRHQVCKQADTILALLLLSNDFTLDEKKRDFDYYEPITTHDSTLSACIHSIIASEIGYDEKALSYFSEVARMDLDNHHKNTQHGVHTACMGGAWLCLVQGFAGMRIKNGELYFSPKLPNGFNSYSFKINFKNRLIQVVIDKANINYRLVSGENIQIQHFDKNVVLNINSFCEFTLG